MPTKSSPVAMPAANAPQRGGGGGGPRHFRRRDGREDEDYGDVDWQHHAALFRTGSYQHPPSPSRHSRSFSVKATPTAERMRRGSVAVTAEREGGGGGLSSSVGGGGGDCPSSSSSPRGFRRRVGGSVRVVRRRPREPEFDFHEQDR